MYRMVLPVVSLQCPVHVYGVVSQESHRWPGLVMLLAPLLPLGDYSTDIHNIARQPVRYGHLSGRKFISFPRFI